MRFPEDLAEKTKNLFPKARNLHDAIDTHDAIKVMGCLKELTIPITNITNEWLIVAMKSEKGSNFWQKGGQILSPL